jgi:hypothetical protein
MNHQVLQKRSHFLGKTAMTGTGFTPENTRFSHHQVWARWGGRSQGKSRYEQGKRKNRGFSGEAQAVVAITK